MHSFFRRLRYWMTRDRLSRELAEEIETHRPFAQENLEAEGLPAADAALESRRRMGNITLARESSRDLWGWPTLDSLTQDLAYALRQVRQQPGFTLLAVGTLALGIGLNVTVFTIYSALALRPWPVTAPERVVKLFNQSDRELRQRAGGSPGGFSIEEADYFASHARTLTGVITARSGGGNQRLADDDAAISWVGGNYFDVLHVPMALGRGFSPADDRISSPSAVAVVAHGYWTRALGADPAIVGRQVQFEGISFTVLGVTAETFIGTMSGRVDIWMPIASAQLLRPTDRWVLNIARKPANCCVSVAARLAPGVTRDDAAAELTLLDARYRRERGIASPGDGVRVNGTEIMAEGRNDVSTELVALFAGVTLVLLLACANVGNLLIARGVTRRREIAVRLALGASRQRIVRQLLIEGLLLAAMAGAVGLWLAMWLPGPLVRFVSADAALQLAPDHTVVTFGAVVTLLSCVLFALAPAMHVTRSAVAAALKDGGPGVSDRFRLRGALLGLQVTTVVVLLASAGLLFRAVRITAARDFGFDMHGLSFASIDAPARGYDAGRVRALAYGLIDAFETAGAAGSVALVSTPPMGSGNIKGTYQLTDSSEEFFNGVYEVSPSYFAVAGVPIVAGRALNSGDTGRPVVVVNETLAQQHWDISSAVGRRISSTPPAGGWNMPGELEIVGVAKDAYMAGLSTVDATIYQPHSGRTLPHALFRTNDRSAANAVATIPARLDPRLRVRVRPLAENLEPRLSGSRTAALFASFLGAIAVALATVGLFGMFAFSVRQRTHEIGVRLALGARRVDIANLILASNGVPLVAGLLAGAVASVGTSRLLGAYLMGISALDPFAFLGVAGVLVSAAAVAMFLPVRRAIRVDPLLALRHE